MRFDTKIAIAVRDDLQAWQKLNVTAFLASGIAGTPDGLLGKPYPPVLSEGHGRMPA